MSGSSLDRASAPAGIALWAILSLPPARRALESSMALHMTVQLPLLCLAGGMIASGLRRSEPRWLREADWFGLPGITLALFTITFWMLPRSLDSALADPRMEAAKFVALPLLAGLPLAASGRRLPVLGRSFLAANLISMLAMTGGLYLAAPARLCAYYRMDQQVGTGKALIALAGGSGVIWLLAALIGWRQPGATAQDIASRRPTGYRAPLEHDRRRRDRRRRESCDQTKTSRPFSDQPDPKRV